MSIYAFTLSIILNMLYVGVNVFIDFKMEYFQVMYVSVAAIYLVAAIFLLKTEFMKQQIELMKIAEAQELVRKEMQEREEKERQEQEKKKRQEKDREEQNKEKEKQNKQEQKKENTGNSEGEPQGSNA